MLRHFPLIWLIYIRIRQYNSDPTVRSCFILLCFLKDEEKTRGATKAEESAILGRERGGGGSSGPEQLTTTEVGAQNQPAYLSQDSTGS